MGLVAAIDALIQLEAADQLEATGRHDEAAAFAANAVEELPGNEALLAWEARLAAGDHDPDFDIHTFLFGERKTEASEETSETEATGEPAIESGGAPTGEGDTRCSAPSAARDDRSAADSGC